jgi:amino acid adenylation domain-containing protein
MMSLRQAPPTPETPLVCERESYALTRRQTLFWLDEQLYPHTPYHHVVLRVELRGALDVAHFCQAYATALSAFDQFRLVFEEQSGEPSQRFCDELDTELPRFDLSAQAEQLEAWIAARAARPFEFSRALFDAALLSLGPERHVFYFCQHHIISDGTSVGLFLRALGQAFHGEALPARSSYAAYLQSERGYRDSPRATRDAAHFNARLATQMPPLSLYGRVRSDRSFGFDRSLLALGAERSARLAELASDSRIELIDAAVSRWVMLATLIFAYVSRVSGAQSAVLATPVPNRSAEFAGTGGLLMEQTFLRVDLDEAETFSSLAAKVRKELFSALRHARHCVSDRGLSYVALNLLRIPRLTLPGLDVAVALDALGALGPLASAAPGDLRDTFGVSVLGFDESEELTLAFDFHRASFEPALQERAKGHFLALCDAFLDDLERELRSVELVSAEERSALLALGRGAEPAESAPDLLQRLAQVARERPEQPALRCNGHTLSYASLVDEVGRLATRLTQLGVRPGTRVAFCLTRGLEEPRVMLATLAVGAAYVPLDAHHPEARLRLILEEAAPQLLITERALAARLEPPPGTTLLLLDAEAEAISRLAPLPLSAPHDSEQAAYVLFTSGSTGRPKGVEVPRRALANFLRSMAHTPGMTPDDRLLAVTTTTFDIAGLELFLPLWVGASLHIADRETVLDPYRMRETLEREEISMLQATPTTFRLLLEAGLGHKPTRLKLLCGGEAISPELAQRLLATGAELWNMYGPTETTIWSSLARLTRADAPIPIGRPIDATQLYVLGPGGKLEPEGVAGELCIGGRGVARGYLNRPELSAQRFVQNPYGPPGDLVYRSGDIARFLPSGELLCLGRIDQQVKIRGFRIELGEIESCLRRAPGVREVVVAAHGPADDLTLGAHWVGDDGAEEQMRLAAARALPSYMQPAAYQQLDVLPLNANGKIDRAQLHAPSAPPALQAAPVCFADALEERMASLFSAALGGRSPGPEQDFFALGGDSVRAIALRRAIHETFSVELPLAVMFDAPTVRGLTLALTAHGERSASLFLELRHGPRDRAPLICLMGIALYRDLAWALDADRAVVGAHVPLSSKGGRPPASVEEIAARYTRLILERVPRGPYHLAGLCFGGLVAFEVAHQLLARGHEVRTLAVFDGLLPGGARYAPLRHAQALLRQPRQLLARAQARLKSPLARPRARDNGAPGMRHDVAAALAPELVADELVLPSPIAQQLTRTYVAHARRLPLPFTLFRATEREEAAWYRLTPALGWEGLSTSLDVRAVPGSHLSILRAGCVEPVASALRAQLRDPSTA